MNTIIEYESPVRVNNDIALPSTLTGTETDLFKCADQTYLHQSQLTVLASVTLGGVASATFNYYLSQDGTNWFPISLYNTSSGEITQRSVVVDSGTYALAGVSSFIDNLPLGGCFAFKITGKSASGTPAFTLQVISRNN